MIGSAPPALSIAANVVARRGQISISASDLFGLVDTDGNPIFQYTLFDPSGFGYWAIKGIAQASNSAINISAAELSQTSFVFGSASETLYVRINDGADWGGWQAFTASPYVNHSPVVTAHTIAAPGDEPLAVSYLFSAADPDGDTITKYQLWDSTPGSLSGHWIVSGAAQGTNTIIDITADELAHTSFRSGDSGADSLRVRAFDGVAWSDWKSFEVIAPIDGYWFSPSPHRAPVAIAHDVVAAHNQSIAASSLFSAQDPDGDRISWYQVCDSTSAASSGHWILDGVESPSNVAIEVAAQDLSHLSFLSGSGDDQLWVRAFDGGLWSEWKEFHVTAPLNQAPVVQASDITAAHGQNLVLATDLFTASDGDGDSITRYAFWDTEGNGHWVLNGVVQATNAEINIAASQLSQMSYTFGSATDTLYVRAFDGTEWGTHWERFTASTYVNQAPVVTAANHVVASDHTVSISALVAATDADGDSITRYQLCDSSSTPNSGHWVVNGVAQAAIVAIDITAEQFSQTSFHAGINISDQLWVRAFDGKDWGAWQPFTVNVSQVMAPPAGGHTQIVTGHDTVATHGQSLDAASLFSVSDADGDQMTRYEFWDSTGDASSGHFVLNGVATQSNVAIEVTAAELANTSFQSGSGTDRLWVRAFDGFQWSDWSQFHVNAPDDHAPVVVASDFTASHNQNIAASALFSVVDAENDSIAAYQFWDATADTASGHWSVNGVALSAAGAAIDVTAAQLSQTTFQSGSGSDDLWVRVNDGMKWSDWKPFHVNAPVNQAPIVTATNAVAAPHQTVAASSFFTATDPDGDAIVKYQLFDSSPDPASGHWTLNGIALANTNSAIDISAAQLVDTAFHAETAPADHLWVRAFDGTAWSSWQEFHLLV